MDILYLLVPLSVALVFVMGALFWLALRGGQFDDLEGPGLRVVADDDLPPNEGGGLAVGPAAADNIRGGMTSAGSEKH